jgi:cytochrome d ubiquinol oxidase subunit II
LWANALGSFGASLIWGVGLANLVYGVPLSSDGDFAGDFWDLFSWYTILAGLAVVLVFAFHGATFLTMRTTGDLCERASRTARRLSLPAAVVGTGLLVATVVIATDRNDKDVFPPVLPAALAVAALVLALVFAVARRSLWSFAMTALGAVLLVATLFTSLYPRVMVSSPNFGNSLTVDNAASAHYTLAVMSVVALIFVPLVLLYQAWTYRVFRHRVGGEEVEPAG